MKTNSPRLRKPRSARPRWQRSTTVTPRGCLPSICRRTADYYRHHKPLLPLEEQDSRLPAMEDPLAQVIHAENLARLKRQAAPVVTKRGKLTLRVKQALASPEKNLIFFSSTGWEP
ncbi:MAG: hypothetical protein PHQ40_21035 [Anaerolineaceae bacterium]|nr:hypothetical protein [Anaerolineaceae bacterium]